MFTDMNKKERKHVRTLSRRRDYLVERISRPGGERLHYDRGEAAALTWILEKVAPELVLKELNRSPD